MSNKTKLITTLSVLFVGGMVALVGAVNEQASRNNAPAYAFADLGARCTTGAYNYEAKAQALSTQAEKDNTVIQGQIAKTQDLSYATASDNTTALNNARSGYLALYNSGGMSKEDYEAKTAQLNATQATSGTPAPSIQSELNAIQASAAKHYDDTKKTVADMRNSATKLNSCADSAKVQRVFTTSDVAEFEALIAGSL